MRDQEVSADTPKQKRYSSATETKDEDGPNLGGAVEPGLWGIVLAGGDGERLKDLAEKLYGYPRCKQYCAVMGSRTLIQHTLARAELLVVPERIVVVVGKNHRKEVQEQIGHHPPETILFQPRNRDTAAGVLLPLTWIASRDPEAIVVILPSDHFILEETRFMAHVRRAKRLVEQDHDLSILLGVNSEAPETGYGWIESMDSGGCEEALRVKAFYEKPVPALADYLYATGCLWNTLVLIARVETLMQMYRDSLPALYERFQRIAPLLKSVKEEEALAEAYAVLPAISISRGLLERNPMSLRVLKVTGVLWSDWGSPKRVCETLERIGRLEELAIRLAKRGHDPNSVLGKNCFEPPCLTAGANHHAVSA